MTTNPLVYNWVLAIIRSYRIRLVIVSVTAVCVAVMFPFVYRNAGSVSGALLTTLVFVGGLLLGTKAGIILWLLTLPLFVFSVTVFAGQNGLTELVSEWPGIVGSFFITLIAGSLKKMTMDLWHQHTAHVKQSELSYADLFNSVTEAIYILDAGFRFINVNNGALKMYGYTRDELIGKTPANVSAPGRNDMEYIARLIQNVFENGEPVSFEFWAVRKNGEMFPKHVVCSKGKYFDQDVVIATARDLTTQKKMQNQLLQSQKLESLGTLTGGIAHEFNNLLAMILGSGEMLQRQMPEGSAMRKYADRIVDSSKRGASISRQLLVFSRPDETHFKQIELGSIIAELETMLAHFLPKSISIQTVRSGDAGVIMGDAGQIHQVLLNLAINAGDAMQNTGVLVIRLFTAAAEEVRTFTEVRGAGSFVCVSITDTGSGMSEEVKSKIFDPFFSTKAPGKGTGLGLSIVHSIVNHHKGHINVESAPGAGTTFTLYFPEVSRPVQDAAAPEAAVSHRSRNESILLVDDEEMIRETVAEFLTESGYMVHTASNGVEGIELFKRFHETIDLVITDMGMPEMGGAQLFKHLREIDPDVKAIVSSGYLEGTTREDLLKLGIKQILTKPCRMQEIHAAVRAVLAPKGN